MILEKPFVDIKAFIHKAFIHKSLSQWQTSIQGIDRLMDEQ